MSLGAAPFFYSGTEAQKQEYLVPMIAGEVLGAFGLTEAEAGSDAGATRTRAMLDDATGEWVIDGQKTFITNSGTPITKCVTITARTGAERDLEHRRRRGHARLRRCSRRTARWVGTPPTRTSSCSTAAACPKTTCSARAARASRRSCASSTTAASRSPRSRSGMAQACLDASVAYAKERQAFGGPIGRYQSIAFKCADMAVAVENARNLMYKAA